MFVWASCGRGGALYHSTMSYEGRSPFKDVIRSVVVGATMVSPSLLQACASAPPPEKPVDIPDPTGTPTTATATPPGTNTAVVATSASAPPTSVVRPRTDPDGPETHPTRGFAGAIRRAHVRG
jgi:hypothetical protein